MGTLVAALVGVGVDVGADGGLGSPAIIVGVGFAVSFVTIKFTIAAGDCEVRFIPFLELPS